jgi:2-polyprenyl-3-methyl-5-hydroxy-6-metoxy-1,4-benzoquinol methylase
MNSAKIRKGDSIHIPGDYQYKALHEGFVVQRFWHDMKREIVSQFGLPGSNDSVLDVGCGSGVISDYLAETAKSVLAIDCNDDAIRFGSMRFSKKNLEFRKVLFHELELPPGSFDVIYILEVIEHLYEEQASNFLLYLRSLLTPQGRIVLSTPNYVSAWPALEWCMDFFTLAPALSEEQHVFKVTNKKLFDLASTSSLKISRIHKEYGIAPFLSILSWKLAKQTARLERSIGCPLGMALWAELVLP